MHHEKLKTTLADNVLRRRMEADKKKTKKSKKVQKERKELTEQSAISEDLQRHSILVTSIVVMLIIAVNNGYTDLASFCVSE